MLVSVSDCTIFAFGYAASFFMRSPLLPSTSSRVIINVNCPAILTYIFEQTYQWLQKIREEGEFELGDS